MFLGKTIKTRVNTETTFDANLTQNLELFWGFILQTGYLTAVEKTFENYEYFYSLKIPNQEVHTVFKNMVHSWLATLSKDLNKPELAETMGKSLILENLEIFHKNLQHILIQTMSYHDFNRNTENAFHAFIAGLMVWLTGIYEIKSNRESGKGRYDLCLIPKKENIPAYIFEFKALAYLEEKPPAQEIIQKELELALNQIDEKLYDTELKAKQINKIIKVALVFYGKQVWMKHK